MWRRSFKRREQLPLLKPSSDIWDSGLHALDQYRKWDDNGGYPLRQGHVGKGYREIHAQRPPTPLCFFFLQNYKIILSKTLFGVLVFFCFFHHFLTIELIQLMIVSCYWGWSRSLGLMLGERGGEGKKSLFWNLMASSALCSSCQNTTTANHTSAGSFSDNYIDILITGN